MISYHCGHSYWAMVETTVQKHCSNPHLPPLNSQSLWTRYLLVGNIHWKQGVSWLGRLWQRRWRTTAWIGRGRRRGWHSCRGGRHQSSHRCVSCVGTISNKMLTSWGTYQLVGEVIHGRKEEEHHSLLLLNLHLEREGTYLTSSAQALLYFGGPPKYCMHALYSLHLPLECAD